MTREEAIKGLKVLRKDFSGYKPNEEMFDMAIKALEQKPCEDCVSRRAVIEITAETGALETQARVRALPSVTPKEKTGHWIVDIKDMDYCFCSECKHRFDVDHLKFSWDKYVFPPHCPNCGAKMFEPQESEDKE